MEMCVDNPREEFGDLFDTHPSVDSRVAALVKFAGGHDPGPLALPPQADGPDAQPEANQLPPGGPWGAAAGPDGDAARDTAVPPATPDAPAQGPWGPPSDQSGGPWGPHSDR
jgi:heat shock protein HtpX